MTTYKLLLKEVKQENKWGDNARDKDEVKKGLVAFPFLSPI